jgi:hypothetical protein
VTTTTFIDSVRQQPRRWLIVPLVITMAPVLVLSRSAISGWQGLPTISSQRVSLELTYQVVALGLAGIALIGTYLLAPGGFRAHLRRGDTHAPVVPVPVVGITPKPGETWFQIGRNFAIVITGVTAATVLFPTIQGGSFDLGRLVGLAPFVVLFALTNAIVEEAIFRFALVATLAGHVDPRSIALLSGGIFGAIHYFGVPGGPLGVVLAGFLGWLLAKSMLETRGVQWALTIHFLQDVVIFSAILLVAP